MSNLGRNQADWRKLFRELGLFLAPRRELRAIQSRFDTSKTKTRVFDVGGTGSLSGWRFMGARIGTNTDEAGAVWIRINAPASGPVQVSVFKAAGGSVQDLVAQGSGAPGTVIALSAQNNSGLSGSVALSAAPVAETDDKHRIFLFPDWAARMHAAFDGSESQHAELIEAYLTAIDSTYRALVSALTAFGAATDRFLETRWKDFQRSSAPTPIESTTSDDQGAISSVFSGLLDDGRDNMADELAAGRQSVARTAVSASAGVFDVSNKGRGALSAPLFFEWARAGRITCVCTDATIGAERFSVAQHVDATGEDFTAENELTVRRTYSDPEIGIESALLDRTLTLDQGSTDDFGSPSGWTIQGESAGNTDQGKIALKVVASGTAFQVEGYSSSSFDPSTKVFTTAPGAAGASVAILAANGSGLSGTAKIGANAVAGHTGLLNLNPFAVGDKFVVDVSVGARGAFQEEIALLYGYALASDDPSKATIDDRYVTGGTLPLPENPQ